MQSCITIVCALLLTTVAIPGRQNTPNFSGTWAIDLSRSEAAGQTPPIHELTMIIQQDVAQVRIEATTNGEREIVTYLPQTVRAESSDTLAKASFHWTGSQLVTDRVTAVNGKAIQVRQVYRLSESATEMRVETTLFVHHGYEGTAAPLQEKSNNYSVAKNVFLKRP